MVDDRPYGGGPGMVMKPEPLAEAVRSAENKAPGAEENPHDPPRRPFFNKSWPANWRRKKA